MAYPLLDLLLQEKLLNEERVKFFEEESQKTGKSIEVLLEESGIVEEEKLAEMKGRVFNLPYTN